MQLPCRRTRPGIVRARTENEESPGGSNGKGRAGVAPRAGAVLMESVLQLYGLAMVIVPVYAYVSLRKRFRDERFSRPAAVVRYAGTVAAPVAMCAVLFALALGVKALTPLELISYELVQTYVLALVLGVLVILIGTAVFALSMLFPQRKRKPDLQEN